MGLAACGRKGALDLPPSAVSEAKQDQAASVAATDPRNVPRIANDPPPIQRRKPLPIDAILN
ncbi:MAG: lipoprotein [Pseudolabrys sp.]|nr:lipoprotein [Pseudolabrys sp.]